MFPFFSPSLLFGTATTPPLSSSSLLPTPFDMETTALILAISAITAIAVYLISVLGVKEKSFEEAIAEQKKRSEELLGVVPVKKKKQKQQQTAVGDKNKNKGGNKKGPSLKKQRETAETAPVEEELEEEEQAPPEDDVVEEQQEEEVAVVPAVEQVVPEVVASKKAASSTSTTSSKSSKKKSKHIEIIDEPEVLQDSFDEEEEGTEEDKEVKRVMASGEPHPHPRRPSLTHHTPPPLSQSTPTKSILINKNNTTPTSTESVTNHFEQIHPKDDVELKKSSTDDSHTHTHQQNNPPKKNRANSKAKQPIQQQTVPTDLPHLLSSTPLSPEETQSLINILLCKSQEDPTSSKISSWTHPPGGDDSLESIKKALAEKTSQLQDTTLNNTQLTVKLRSLRSEFQQEKLKLTTTNKKLEEILNLKQGELQNMQMRLRQISEMQMGKEQDVSNKVALACQRVKEVQEENERIKNEFGRREGEWRRVEGELGALKVQYQKQASQLSTAFTSNGDLTTQLTNLKQALTHTEQSLQQATVSHKSETTSLLGKISSLEAQGKLRETEYIKLQQEISMITEEKLNLQKKMIHLEQLVKEKDIESQLSKTQIQDHVTKIEELQRNQVNFQKSAGTSNEDLKREVGSLKEKCEELRGKNRGLYESLKGAEEELVKEKEGRDRLVSVLGGVLHCEEGDVQTEEGVRKAVGALVERSGNKGDAEEVIKLRDNCVKLQEEVRHYQGVLANTESLLSTLQSSIESEEQKWLGKLEEKEKRLEEALCKLNDNNSTKANGHTTTNGSTTTVLGIGEGDVKVPMSQSVVSSSPAPPVEAKQISQPPTTPTAVTQLPVTPTKKSSTASLNSTNSSSPSTTSLNSSTTTTTTPPTASPPSEGGEKKKKKNKGLQQEQLQQQPRRPRRDY